MMQLKTVLLSFLVSMSISAFAQIAKGNYNLAGDVGLSVNLQKSKFRQNFGGSMSINPSVSKFITDKWLVGLQPHLGASVSKSSFPQGSSPQFDVTYKSQAVGLRLNTRYYFTRVKNVHFFGRAGLDVLSNWQNAVYSNARLKGNTTTFNYDIGLGANVFLNPEVALESTLSYTGQNIGYNQTDPNNQQATRSGNAKSDVLSLSISLNSFLNLSSKTEEKETPQYIRRNRQILGGQVSLNRYSSEAGSSTYFSLSPQFSQFITSHLLLKGEVNIFGNVDDTKNTQVNTRLSTRYYIPLGKRFFMYPELNAAYQTGRNSYFVISSLNELSPNTFTAGLGFGGSYFLSENLAIDASFVQTQMYFGDQTSRYTSSLLGLGNVGLLYFIR
jgi:Outer membrane protein beta-barrel domain